MCYGDRVKLKKRKKKIIYKMWKKVQSTIFVLIESNEGQLIAI